MGVVQESEQRRCRDPSPDRRYVILSGGFKESPRPFALLTANLLSRADPQPEEAKARDGCCASHWKGERAGTASNFAEVDGTSAGDDRVMIESECRKEEEMAGRTSSSRTNIAASLSMPRNVRGTTRGQSWSSTQSKGP